MLKYVSRIMQLLTSCLQMSSHVSTLIPTLCKPFMTNITSVGAFSRVNSHMPIQAVLWTEFFSAHWTVKVALQGVWCSVVHPQMLHCRITFIAFVTLKVFHAAMLKSFHVFVVLVLDREGNVTFITSVDFVVEHVLIQLLLSWVEPVARFTLKLQVLPEVLS